MANNFFKTFGENLTKAQEEKKNKQQQISQKKTENKVSKNVETPTKNETSQYLNYSLEELNNKNNTSLNDVRTNMAYESDMATKEYGYQTDANNPLYEMSLRYGYDKDTDTFYDKSNANSYGKKTNEILNNKEELKRIMQSGTSEEKQAIYDIVSDEENQSRVSNLSKEEKNKKQNNADTLKNFLDGTTALSTWETDPTITEDLIYTYDANGNVNGYIDYEKEKSSIDTQIENLRVKNNVATTEEEKSGNYRKIVELQQKKTKIDSYINAQDKLKAESSLYQSIDEGNLSTLNTTSYIVAGHDDNFLERSSKAVVAGSGSVLAGVVNAGEAVADYTARKAEDTMSYLADKVEEKGNTELANKMRTAKIGWSCLNDDTLSSELTNNIYMMATSANTGASSFEQKVLAIENSIANQLTRTTLALATGFGDIVSVGLAGASTFGDSYREYLSNGMDADVAMAGSVVKGVITGAVEKLKWKHLSSVFSSVSMQSHIGNIINTILKNGSEEFGEEVVEKYLDDWIDYFTDKANSIVEKTEEGKTFGEAVKETNLTKNLLSTALGPFSSTESFGEYFETGSMAFVSACVMGSFTAVRGEVQYNNYVKEGYFDQYKVYTKNDYDKVETYKQAMDAVEDQMEDVEREWWQLSKRFIDGELKTYKNNNQVQFAVTNLTEEANKHIPDTVSGKAEYEKGVQPVANEMAQNEAFAQESEEQGNLLYQNAQAILNSKGIDLSVEEYEALPDERKAVLSQTADLINQYGMKSSNNSIKSVLTIFNEMSDDKKAESLAVAEYGKKLGFDVRHSNEKYDSNFYALDENGNRTGKVSNAYIDTDGTIVLNTNAPTTTKQVTLLAHEITHTFENDKTGKYTKLVNLIKNSGDYAKVLASAERTYKGVKGANAENEAIAKYIEKNIANDNFIKSVINYDSSLASKIYQDIKSFFSTDEKQKIINAWEKAFADVERENYENENIKSSLEDSDGNILTKQQQQFFKRSVIRDENGNLQVVYHTSNNLFSEFNSQNNVNYYTDNKDMSKTYSNKEVVDVTNELLEKGGEDNGYLYSGYANVTSPYTLGGYNGKSWKNLNGGEYTIKPTTLTMLQNAYDKVKGSKNIAQDLLNSGAYVSEYLIENPIALANLIKGNTDVTETNGNYKFDGELKTDDVVSAVLAINEYAKTQGYNEVYDGVVFDGIYDNSEYIGSREPSKVIATFNSNQFKLTANENPTISNDIRYSIQDSDGNELSRKQQEHFVDSKVRDENGNLLVVYHGTNGEFNVFNKYSYFTANKEYAKRYGNNIKQGYLNIAKPFNVDTEEGKQIFFDYVKSGNANGINPQSTTQEIESYIENGIDWTEANNLIDYLTENGYDYDGLVLNEGGDLVNGEVVSRGNSYVAFNQNQFKNIDNTNPTESNDVRYSLGGDEGLNNLKNYDIEIYNRIYANKVKADEMRAELDDNGNHKYSEEDIHKATGWFVDTKDSKNKFEFYDDGSIEKITNYVLAENNGYKRFVKKSNKYPMLKDIIGDDSMFFSMYPELKNVKLFVKSEHSKTENGYFWEPYNVIGVVKINTDGTNKSAFSLSNTIAHEIQHYIQSVEDFSYNKSNAKNWENIDGEQEATRVGNAQTNTDLRNSNYTINWDNYDSNIYVPYKDTINNKFHDTNENIVELVNDIENKLKDNIEVMGNVFGNINGEDFMSKMQRLGTTVWKEVRKDLSGSAGYNLVSFEMVENATKNFINDLLGKNDKYNDLVHNLSVYVCDVKGIPMTTNDSIIYPYGTNTAFTDGKDYGNDNAVYRYENGREVTANEGNGGLPNGNSSVFDVGNEKAKGNSSLDKNELVGNTSDVQYLNGESNTNNNSSDDFSDAINLSDYMTTNGNRFIEDDSPQNDEPKANERIAQILTEKPELNPKKDGGKKLFKWLQDKIGDKGWVIHDISVNTGNKQLEAIYDWSLNHTNMANNTLLTNRRSLQDGSIIGESLANIVDSMNSLQGRKLLFEEYMYNLLNTDRMTLEERYPNSDIPGMEPMANKPVFGESVTAETSRKITEEIERLNPDFKELSQRIYDYINEDLKLAVEYGVASQEKADSLREKYPHYVPILRNVQQVNRNGDGDYKSSNQIIKNAKGSNIDMLSLEDALQWYTRNAYSSATTNKLYNELANTISDNYKQAVEVGDTELLEEMIGNTLVAPNGDEPAKIIYYSNGKRYMQTISDRLYEALSPRNDAIKNILGEGLSGKLQSLNTLRRNIITAWNPMFTLTNGLKDIQDAIINTKNGTVKFSSAYAKAVNQIATKGDLYNLYIANGGLYNNFSSIEGNKVKGDNVVSKGINSLANLNEAIEMAPRLAEFIASLESGKTIEQAMFDASEITINFKRGGDIAKTLDRHGATFLNASIQGTLKQYHNFQEAKQQGTLLKYMAKLSIISSIPLIALNGLVWGKDKDYEDLSDYIKKNYYIIYKKEDGTFVRIPKGRVMAFYQNVLKNGYDTVTGKTKLWDAFVDDIVSFKDNVAPNNVVDNNIVAPVIQVMNNKTWYGENLVPTRLQNLPNSEQYDETTDYMSVWFGKLSRGLSNTTGIKQLELSPYKINYLVDQYSGGVGDIVLPYFTPQSTSSNSAFAPIMNKFTTDPVMKNQKVTNFYSLKENMQTEANRTSASDETILASKYLSSVSSTVSALYSDIREIQNDTTLGKDAKYKKVREIKEQINEICSNAISSYEEQDISNNCAVVGGVAYIKNDDGWQKVNSNSLVYKYYNILTKNGKTGSSTLSTAYAMTTYNTRYKEDGKAYENSKALQVRKSLKEQGVYEEVVKDIKEGNSTPSNWGLSKTVVSYNDSMFEKEYETMMSLTSLEYSKSGKEEDTSYSGANDGSTKTDTNKTTKKVANKTTTTKIKVVKPVSIKTTTTTTTTPKTTSTKTNYLNSYKKVLGRSETSNGTSAKTCRKCGSKVVPVNGRCPVCGAYM